MTADVSHGTDVTPVRGLPSPRSRPAARPAPRRPEGSARLRYRRVLVVGSDDAVTGPAATSPAAELAAHLARRAGAVMLVTGVPRCPDGTPEPRYRYGLTFHEEPMTPAMPSVTRLRHAAPRRSTPGGRLVGELSFATRGALAPLGEPPDVVVAVTPGPGGAAAAARIAQRHRLPLLVVVHDLLGGDPGRAAGTLARLERQALGRATRVAVTSRTLHAAVLAYGVPADRVAVLPHASEPGPVVDRLTARRRLGRRPGAFLVGVPDPLSDGQDLAAVLAAGRALGPRAELLLARAGEFEPLVEQVGGRPRVHVVDTYDEPARALALAAADVLVVGDERRPGPPGALGECLRAGRPVVATVDAAGPAAREITMSRGAGLVVRRGDPALLARAITELRADDDLRAAMGCAGLAFAHCRVDQGAALLAVDALVDALCLDG